MWFFIDSLQSFIAESRYSLYWLRRKVVTPRIISSGELQKMYDYCAQTLACHLIRRDDTPGIV